MISINRRLLRIDAHHRVIVAAVVAGLTIVGLMDRLPTPALVITAWNAFAITATGLAWAHILFVSDPMDCIKSARLQDSGRTLIFVFVLASACASLFAIAFFIVTRKSEIHSSAANTALLTIGTVISSWALIHTIFALHYAHIFYEAGESEKKERQSPILFPDEGEPDYLDFAYFSFVLGTSCQVSDVQICSRRVRRLALLHGLLAFLFNTVIVALSINIVASLFS